MRKHIWLSLVLVGIFVSLAVFIVRTEREGSAYQFKFGLDLIGGTELVYTADTSGIEDVAGAMESLREVIERRVNVFGVSEPIIQTESSGIISGNRQERLIVELPGVTDIDKAVELIGQTPVLEFRLARIDASQIIEGNPEASLNDLFEQTGLTGRYLDKASVQFDPNTGAAVVGLQFDDEGAELFATITRENKGQILAIILDGSIISAPVIVDEITGGEAQITGTLTPEEARDLVRNLNYGALPVPIELTNSQSIGATLGTEALDTGVRAGVIGFAILSLFMILWYRLPGVVSVVALVSYTILSLVIFKLVPVTLTAAGIAGFILSLGMAVDANILIFERLREELNKGKDIKTAIDLGFSRAWAAIRDSNVSSIITAVILFWIGTAGVKGFALTFGLGVGVSMLSAIVVSRTFLLAIVPKHTTPLMKKLFSNGLS